MGKEILRKLPKIDAFIEKEEIEPLIHEHSRITVVEALREALDSLRRDILEGNIIDFDDSEVFLRLRGLIKKKEAYKLKKVVNAAGIVIHTNLGRSLLSDRAADRVQEIIKGYSNLEYDLEKGCRGSRYSNVEEILKKVTGAEAALVVNNNAAAVMLVLNTLCSNREVIVSRGQLVEIGGSFRIPEVMKFSGATLIEVGTTNRTHSFDYENSITENTGALMKVHTSNYKIMGFTDEVTIEELKAIAERFSLPLIEDIGSGVLINLEKYGLTHEPTVQESIEKGVDVLTFSGDKMLGGPQAGIIVGKKCYIDKIKKNQLTRALRVDKMTLAALEGTLKSYLHEEEAIKEIPTLSMMLMEPEVIMARAQKLMSMLHEVPKHLSFQMTEDYSMVGGGSMPLEKLKTYVIKINSTKFSSRVLEELLRSNEIPIITRISNQEVYLDVRTILDDELDIILEALKKMGE